MPASLSTLFTSPWSHYVFHTSVNPTDIYLLILIFEFNSSALSKPAVPVNVNMILTRGSRCRNSVMQHSRSVNLHPLCLPFMSFITFLFRPSLLNIARLLLTFFRSNDPLLSPARYHFGIPYASRIIRHLLSLTCGWCKILWQKADH